MPPAFSIAASRSVCLHKPSIAGLAVLFFVLTIVRMGGYLFLLFLGLVIDRLVVQSGLIAGLA